MDRLASVLLRRTGRVHPPVGDAEPDGWVDHLEIDLAERGWVLDPAARASFASLGEPVRTAWADWLLATIDADLGADRPHVPLFRRFPDSIPGNTERLYIDRVLAFLLQEPEQPCILCGREGSVAPVSPCGHLVCHACFDGADYSACPICHQRIDPDDPFLSLATPRWRPPPSVPLRMRRVLGQADRDSDAVALRDNLVQRPSALSPADRSDLAVLIEATTAPGDLAWLTAEVPTRETLAAVLAIALRSDLSVALPQVVARWTTATDIARTLWAFAGGDPGLVLPAKPERPHPTDRLRPLHEPAVTIEPSRVGPIPRAVRRSALAALNALDLRNAVEDVLRHPTVWKRLGERLHPFETAKRHPQAAVCFAVLRGSAHPKLSAVGQAILAADEAGVVRAVVSGDLVQARPKTFAATVEAYLADGDSERAAQLLSTRPGDFLRRLDHLARLTPAERSAALAQQAGSAASTAAPSAALAAYAALSARDQPPPALAISTAAAVAVREQIASVESTAARSRLARVRSRLARTPSDGSPPSTAEPAPERLARLEGRVPGTPRRVFFPRGDVMHAWSALDRRRLVAPGAPDLIRRAIADSLVERASSGRRFDLAIVDAALVDHPIPTRARAVSPASRTLLRGARVPLPAGDTLRLFLHWMDPDDGTRVDLDLSVLCLDVNWGYVGHCDYTKLRFKDGAVHSGDLTSAPPPLGATEFLDLRLPALHDLGVAHVVPIVFSFNNVPFDRLTNAIAGFSLPTDDSELFDAARVFTRFDLVGSARVLVPMVVHLQDRTLRWADLNIGATGYGHAVHRYSEVLGHAAEDLELAFGTARRATMLQLAAVHAAGRAERVWVRYGDGSTREVAPTFDAIVAASGQDAGAGTMPPLDDLNVLFVAARHLPEQVSVAGPGSCMVAATSGDAAANAEPVDLLADL